MNIETEGIILREVKAAGGRRMLEIFTEKSGKISAGTSITGGGKSKSTLAVRPFTHGRYSLYKGRSGYSLNRAESIHSYYGIGEDVEKYIFCSYVLELTDKLLQENQPAPALYRLILDFFGAMEKRSGRYEILVLAYQIKALRIMGVMPVLDRCVMCGSTEELKHISVREGGMICDSCYRKVAGDVGDSLIYGIDFGIVDVIEYISKADMKDFEKLAVKEEVTGVLKSLLKEYYSFHLDVRGLKSEAFV